MSEPSPLPRSATGTIAALAAIATLVALVLSVGLPTLRQGRLLDEAIALSTERTEAATRWLDREDSVIALLESESTRADALTPAFLLADDSGAIEPLLTLLGDRHDARLVLLRLGTRRTASVLDTAPATAVFEGSRTALPELLDGFYGQERLVRLVALDVELPRFGEDVVQATLRWEYAAPTEADVEADDPTLRWSPPVLVSRAGPGAIDAWNRSRWDALEDATTSLRSLAPRLRRLAMMDAQRAALEQRRTAVTRWQEAQAAEATAVQRRLPELLRRMDLSADGRAALRPGAGGRLIVGDASGSLD